MSIVWMTNGRRAVVGILEPWLSTLYLHLFSAPSGLSSQLTLSDFTEPTFNGYAPILLNRWTGNFLNANLQGEVDEQFRVFTVATGGPAESVLGYFVADVLGNVLWAELDPAGPTVLAHTGDMFSVKPRVMCGPLL